MAAVTGACRELADWLYGAAEISPTGTIYVRLGSSELARKLGKSAGTITRQIGELRDAGIVVRSRRGLIELARPDRPRLSVVRPDDLAADPPGDDSQPVQHVTVIAQLAQLATDHPDMAAELVAAIGVVTRDAGSRLGRDKRDAAATESRSHDRGSTADLAVLQGPDEDEKDLISHLESSREHTAIGSRD